MSVEYPSDIDTSAASAAADLRSGARVSIRGNPVGTTLRSRTGYIVGPDTIWDGFFIVHLDEAAIYHHANGETEELAEIREGIDNLFVLPA